MSEIEGRLRQALKDMRYTSSRTGLQRGIMEHHVEAIVGAVMPVIQPVDLANAHIGRMIRELDIERREGDYWFKRLGKLERVAEAAVEITKAYPVAAATYDPIRSLADALADLGGDTDG